jgi:hypothetical protein
MRSWYLSYFPFLLSVLFPPLLLFSGNGKEVRRERQTV